MSKITDYSFLFDQMFGKNKASSFGTFRLDQVGSKTVQSQMKTAGIDTNSAQYKAVMKSMMENGKGMAYTNVQAIKNRMSRYDKDGDRINSHGLAGLEVNEKTIASKHRIIDIPETSREEMFQLTKKEFLQEKGVANGDTTKRTDVYINLYRKMPKKDRLAAGNTLEKYERAYTQACVDAVRAVNPNWKVGQDIPSGVLDNISRKVVEAAMKTSGGVDVKI